MYVLIGVVVLVILYFVFFRKKSEDIKEEETILMTPNYQQQASQPGYTSTVAQWAQIISSLTGLVIASTGGSGFLGGNSSSQPEVNS